ncbi:MAG TPA: TIM barrel protein, partial [Clostridia bacterium]
PDIAETRDLMARHSLKAAGFTLPGEYRKDEAAYSECIKSLESYVRYAREAGMERCITWVYPSSSTMDYAENFEFHRRRLAWPAEILKEYGIYLGLEFIGPPKLRKGVKHEFIHNLDQMMELCTAIGTGNVGLLMDVYHWDLAGQTFADFKKIPDEKWIVHAHIMDAPAGVPPEEQEDGVRCLPGATGVLRTAEFFQGLKDLGYTGPVQPEPFSPWLADLSFDDAVAKVGAALDSVWPG